MKVSSVIKGEDRISVSAAVYTSCGEMYMELAEAMSVAVTELFPFKENCPLKDIVANLERKGYRQRETECNDSDEILQPGLTSVSVGLRRYFLSLLTRISLPLTVTSDIYYKILIHLLTPVVLDKPAKPVLTNVSSRRLCSFVCSQGGNVPIRVLSTYYMNLSSEVICVINKFTKLIGFSNERKRKQKNKHLQ